MKNYVKSFSNFLKESKKAESSEYMVDDESSEVEQEESEREPTVVGNVYLDDNSDLSIIKDDLYIKGNLNIMHMRHLTSLPSGILVDGDVRINDCPELKRIGKNLEVTGDFSIKNCPSITHLPKGVKVGGDIYFRNCQNMQDIPEDLEIGGNIVYDKKTRFAMVTGGLRDIRIVPERLRGKLIPEWE